ncbi:hypothetical protein EDB19DRAFT_2044986 [Suillus lakei]|nr:hypothetical protein EDB19DRAFT_2044986 [Suillus lakei]
MLVSSYSLWPARYIQLLKHVSNHRSRSRIIIPLSMVLQDAFDGVNELHDPVSDLEDLKMKSYDAIYPSHFAVTSAHHLDRLIRSLTTAPSPSADHHRPQLLMRLASVQLPWCFQTTLELNSLSSHISLSTTRFKCPCMINSEQHSTLQIFDTRKHISSTPRYIPPDTLAALSTTLTYDPVARNQRVNELSIKDRCKGMQMLKSEALLLRRSWLEHWDMVLEVR